jgi:hypothetical protein
MFAKLLDGVKGAPVSAVLPLALARHLLLHGVNQEVIRPQNEYEQHDPKDHELLEHVAETTASPNFLLADFLREPARDNVLQLRGLPLGFLTFVAGLAKADGWTARAGNHLPVSWTSHQFPAVGARL